MTHLRRVVAVVGVLIGVCVGSWKESGAQSSTLTAFYTAPVASMAPMWIAKEAGYFKKNGLDVKLVFIASGPIGTASVLGGETDVGIIGGFAPIRAMTLPPPTPLSSTTLPTMWAALPFRFPCTWTTSARARCSILECASGSLRGWTWCPGTV